MNRFALLIADSIFSLLRMIEASAQSQTEQVTIGMESGDQLPLVETLYGLLLNSGNDAALAIAEPLGEGSIDRYVGSMNDYAASLGLLDTHYANPHGLDYGDHYSSAYDQAAIGRALLRQPLLRTIVATTRHNFDGPPLWAFRNINPLPPGLDSVFAGVVGSQRKANIIIEQFQQVAKVLRSGTHVVGRIEDICHPKTPRRRRHELHQTGGATL